MAKRCHADMLDAALNILKNNVTRMTLCSAEPTTYAEGNATYALADVTLVSADLVVAAGDGAGNTPRKCTIAAQNSVLIDTTGAGTHVALLDVTGSRLLYVTTCTSINVTANGSNTVNFPAWKIELGAPT